VFQRSFDPKNQVLNLFFRSFHIPRQLTIAFHDDSVRPAHFYGRPYFLEDFAHVQPQPETQSAPIPPEGDSTKASRLSPSSINKALSTSSIPQAEADDESSIPSTTGNPSLDLNQTSDSSNDPKSQRSPSTAATPDQWSTPDCDKVNFKGGQVDVSSPRKVLNVKKVGTCPTSDVYESIEPPFFTVKLASVEGVDFYRKQWRPDGRPAARNENFILSKHLTSSLLRPFIVQLLYFAENPSRSFDNAVTVMENEGYSLRNCALTFEEKYVAIFLPSLSKEPSRTLFHEQDTSHCRFTFNPSLRSQTQRS